MDVFSKLSRAFEAKEFDPFICRIRFPFLKRLQSNLAIDFEYPITAIVGSNGTNKTTVLRALEACPAGKSLSDYWFDTSLDVIDTTRGTPRYIHEYQIPSGKIAEVIKVRVIRKGRRSDYFETDAPRKNDNMKGMPQYDAADKEYRTKDRWKPIAKNVVYLDFRAQLPAYDILMNFDWRYGFASFEEKKGWARRTSVHLKRVLDNLLKSNKYFGREKIIEPTIELSAEEVEAIRRILGKDYSRIRLVKHDYFKCAGWTAILDANDLEYSEAFAGSGEFAVVMLVHAIKSASEKSLILLDEPETSLHPGAQKALTRFIAREALEHKHQIVMSTHSSAMIEQLPDCARKLLASDPSTGEVYVANDSATLEESFVRLGATHKANTVIVEDRLAKELVLAAARRRGDDFLQPIDVKVIPGGADTLIKRAVTPYAMKNDDCIIILDGDKRPAESLLERNVLDEELESELEKIGIKDDDLIRDGGDGNKKQQLAFARRTVLNWCKTHIGYLPGNECPENLILQVGGDNPLPSPDKAKEYWITLTRERLGRSKCEQVYSDNVLQFQQEYIAHLDNNAFFDEILNEISELHGFTPDD